MEADNQQAPREDIVFGRNPVMELLRSGAEVESVLLQRGETRGPLPARIAAMAKDRGIPVKEVPREKLDALCGGVHQGVAAVTASCRYGELEDIFARAGEEPVLIVVADGIEDPHNLGAMIRSAEAAGAHGGIVPRRRGAGLTAAAFKSSAGAAAHIPVVRVANLVQTVEQLKKRGVWVYAADMGGSPWCSVRCDGPAALVVGAEDKGVSRLLREHCDHVLSLPMYGRVGSLNASVAAGIVLYEMVRQRRGLPTAALSKGE
jgi:23S rRNA (guanosine2251-2'-O)-methyltransferase